MSRIHEGLEYRDFVQPEGIVTATVCSKSGKLAVPGLCDVDGSAYTEIFAADNVPTSVCDKHVVGTVCSACGLRATDTCPYIAPGVIVVDDEGDPYASTPYCEHSYMNGIPLFAIPEGMTINDFVNAVQTMVNGETPIE